MNLPDFVPAKVWRAAPLGFVPARYMSVYPPIQKMAGGAIIVDQCRKGDGSWEVVIFNNKDHPNLATLPGNAPRVVKQLYRREWQLRYLRAVDASFIRDIDAAYAAWEKFCAAKAAA